MRQEQLGLWLIRRVGPRYLDDRTHSLSPVLHRAAYAALDLDWSYEAIDCGVTT